MVNTPEDFRTWLESTKAAEWVSRRYAGARKYLEHRLMTDGSVAVKHVPAESRLGVVEEIWVDTVPADVAAWIWLERYFPPWPASPSGATTH